MCEVEEDMKNKDRVGVCEHILNIKHFALYIKLLYKQVYFIATCIVYSDTCCMQTNSICTSTNTLLNVPHVHVYSKCMHSVCNSCNSFWSA